MRYFILIVSWFLASLSPVITKAQYTISTIAGGFNPEGAEAKNVSLYNPQGLTTDKNGNVYIADRQNHRIRKVTTDGIITTIAGTGREGYTGDGGKASNAQLIQPERVAVDLQNNLYIVERYTFRIRKVDLNTGIITTIAGTGVLGYSGDGGAATLAQIGHIRGFTIGIDGSLYLAQDSRIRKIDAQTNIISTIVGTGNSGYSGDGGLATLANIRTTGLAIDRHNNLYIADGDNHVLRKVDAISGIINTIAGTGTSGYSGDGGSALLAQITDLNDITLDSVENIYIVQNSHHVIRKITARTGIITTIAGIGTPGYSEVEELATQAQLHFPKYMAIDGKGNLFMGDEKHQRIRKIEASTGIISTIAGNGNKNYHSGGYSGDGGPATSADLSYPSEIALGSLGNIYFIDKGNARVRKINRYTRIISTIAGTGNFTDSLGDGKLATEAKLVTPFGIALDNNNNIFITENHGNRVRKVEASTGIINTIAGTGEPFSTGDGGFAIHAKFNFPHGIILDKYGDIYLADNNRIRKITTSTGIINAFAGTGKLGYSGDGNLAILAELYWVQGIALDHFNNLYAADAFNNCIRKINANTGTISTITGLGGIGNEGYSGDGGPATFARLNNPSDIAVDNSGNIYIADSGNDCIRKIDVTTGNIITIAGTGVPGYSGDGGLATCAQLNHPRSIAIDASGNIYISDAYNHCIRKLTPSKGPEINIKKANTTIINGGRVSLDSTLYKQPKSLDLTIENIGLRKLKIDSIQVTGDFELQGIQSLNIEIGQNFVISIAIDENKAGNKEGELIIYNSDFDESRYVISLSGTVKKASQQIIFSALPTKTFRDSSFEITAQGGESQNPVTFTSSSKNVAIIEGNNVIILGAGTTLITAHQNGNNNYLAAPEVSQLLVVNKAHQIITFNLASDSVKTHSTGYFILKASTSSGLPIAYSSTNTNVAHINGDTVFVTSLGQTIITAKQTGDQNYNPALEVSQSLTIIIDAVTNLDTQIQGRRAVFLSWDINLTQTLRTKIERREAEKEKFYFITELNGTRYVDTSRMLIPGKTYFYRATAIGLNGLESLPSDEMGVVIPKDEVVTGKLPKLSADFLTVYPNPNSQGIFYCKYQAGSGLQASLTVFTSSGKILRKYAQVPTQIDLSTSPAGVYYLWLVTEQGKMMKKIVKH